jgi:small conductance mechanosensitive channel
MLDTVGIKTTSFVAVLGTASLAVGLSLQGSLSNFAGGVLILMLKPFKVGDYIIDSSDGKEGTVTKIDLFYTTLITPDNKKTVIPNGSLSNTSLTNVTAFETRRVDFEIGISYSADISKAKSIIEETAKANELVLKDKEIFVFVSNLDSSQVTMGIRVWTNTSDYWTVKFELTEAVKKALDENNIEIPFNQLVVHMEK